MRWTSAKHQGLVSEMTATPFVLVLRQGTGLRIADIKKGKSDVEQYLRSKGAPE